MNTRYQSMENETHGVRRHATSKGLSFGPIATAITIGVVALLFSVTFIGDWLRTPGLTVEASPSIISPNGDNVQDMTNFSYTLNEDAESTVQVFNQSNRLIQTILPNQFQTRGQHVVMWNGKDNLGQTVGDGRYRVEVTAKGTVRASAQSANVVVDTVAPTLRLANLDNAIRVRDANLSIQGLTDADAVVQLQGDARIIPVDKEGQFSLKRQLAEGTNAIELSATDPAGNITKIKREAILVTRPPEVKITSPSNDTWTNESLIKIAGVVPAKTLIKVNGQEATIAETGEFQHEVVVQEGDNILRLEATDDVGNKTSQEVIVHRKVKPPVLELNVADNAVFQQSDIQVMGKTDVGATVSVGGQAVQVSPLGEFQTTVKLLKGQNELSVIAEDQAGNITKQQRVINYDIMPPESEVARVARNLPSLTNYLTPVAISLPILLMLAYLLTRPVSLVLSAESSAFRPGLPEEGRLLRIAVDLSKAARTTVEVKDRRGNVVATLLHRRHRGSGQQTLFWNGYDDFGRVVPPGDYTVEATASTTGGTVTGNLNISVGENSAVQQQYERTYPHQEARIIDRQEEFRRAAESPTVRRARRRA